MPPLSTHQLTHAQGLLDRVNELLAGTPQERDIARMQFGPLGERIHPDDFDDYLLLAQTALQDILASGQVTNPILNLINAVGSGSDGVNLHIWARTQTRGKRTE